ncbi:hypothetical protein Hanom_Chr17g01558161 [Helianthus anomalus]
MESIIRFIFVVSWHVVQQMPADVVVLWQEAAEGKVWSQKAYGDALFSTDQYGGGSFDKRYIGRRMLTLSLKRTWQQQKNWATTREQGSNKVYKRCYFQWEEKWNGEIHSCWER